MSARINTTEQDLDLAHATLSRYDPWLQTIVVGSTAIIAQLAEYSIESPIGCEDVDVLCPKSYFNQLRMQGPFFSDIRKFQVRWPYGRLKERGGTFPAVDIYPADDTRLRFTACVEMSDNFYGISYDSALADEVEAQYMRCLRIGKILNWISIIGRDKDIQTVQSVLPIAASAGLVDEGEHMAIAAQLELTTRLKAEHPEYFVQTT